MHYVRICAVFGLSTVAAGPVFRLLGARDIGRSERPLEAPAARTHKKLNAGLTAAL
jgi:hypothetical protein